MEKRPFFRADMAGLGKYHTGGFGRIGVYRVNVTFLCVASLVGIGFHFSFRSLVVVYDFLFDTRCGFVVPLR